MNLFQNILDILTGEKIITEQNKYRFICYGLSAVHLILILRFFLLKYTALYIYNIFVAVFYAVFGPHLAKKQKFSLLYYCCYIEITFCACASTLALGWEWGFMTYIIALIPVAFYLSYSSSQFDRSIHKPAIFSVISILIFIIVKVISACTKPYYVQNLKYDRNLTFTYSFNAVVSIGMLVLFSILFTVEIRQNELRLEKHNSILERLSSKDPLTGLLNRRSMDLYLKEAIKKSEDDDIGFSVIIADIDDFKKINDTYGHNIGDEVLENVATTICDAVMSKYHVCRWGGEEILILIPENRTITKAIAEKIRQAVEEIRVEAEGQTIQITMTFGVAQYASGILLKDLISTADNRLYYGKRHGKNCVYDEIPDQNPNALNT